MQELQSTLNQTLISVAITCITLLGAYATFYLKKLGNKLKLEVKKVEDDAQRNLIFQALYRLDDVAGKTVSALEQTAADIIRNNLSLTKEMKADELKALGLKAYDQIVNTLEPEYVKALNDSLGDFEGYVKDTIEDKVRLLKMEKKKV